MKSKSAKSRGRTLSSEPLYFKSLTVQNLRCFGDEPQTLDLTDDEGKPAKWTLLLGDNGVGKTTLLQCFVYFANSHPFLSEDLSKVMYLASELLRWKNSAVRFNTDLKSHKRAKVSISLVGQGFHQNVEMEWDDQIRSFTALEGDQKPLIQAYGPNRSVQDHSSLPSHPDGVTAGTLFAGNDAYLVNPRDWLRELDYGASKESAIKERMVNRYEQVRALLIDVLPDVSDISITSPTRQNPFPEVEFRTPYGWVELRNVAYGYQSLVAWIVDFAYRLIQKYPDSEDPLSEPAICLVDELDLHLHPSWQRDVMAYLSDKFPNTQFIATVHSPLVVQAAPSVKANVAVLRRVHGEPFDHVVIDNDPEIVASWRLDQLLASDLYSTVRGPITPRNPSVEEKIQERREILAKSKLSKKDKQRLSEITKQIDIVPYTETSEHRKAQELLSKAYQAMSAEDSTQ